MRREIDRMPIDGTIVIGEGERDEAPMLYIGETVGIGQKAPNGRIPRSTSPSTRSREPTCAPPALRRACGAGRVRERRAAPRPRYLHGEARRRPVEARRGSRRAGAVTTSGRLRSRSAARVEDLVVIVLDRPRHEQLIADIRATGARIRLISDGDLSAGIIAAVVGTGVHAVMGIGGAPGGVLTAAAMRCLNGEIFARLVISTPEHEERCDAMGITRLQEDLPLRRISPQATASSLPRRASPTAR